MTDREQLHRDGYVLLRHAIPAQWLGELCAVFEASAMPSEQWPVPRGMDWRHALLDVEPKVQAVCRLPRVLAAVGELIGEGFFLSQVEGREPLAGRWPVAVISYCTGICRRCGLATPSTPWCISTTTAPITARPVSSPAAIALIRLRRRSISMTSPAPYSCVAGRATSWCSMPT